MNNMIEKELNGSALDSLYELYGFRKRKSYESNVRVYTYRTGYFNNADIVPLIPSVDTDKDVEQYQKAGFACSVRKYTEIKDAEFQLFEGFFALVGTRNRFTSELEKFKKRQSELLGITYKYISPPYREMYGPKYNGKDQALVGTLLSELKETGPRLFIIEAAAGYGKTCASFEILDKVISKFEKKIPFLIELSRNRQAKIFRYVLLDEIDRIFPSLNAELVNSQIENGNLILIIDGFDELLHRTESLSSDYDEVEPMLETISDLLKKNAKIILTTRRTAIFSGDHFHTWMENHEGEFKISRYSLLKPNIEDWLSYGRREILEKNDFPIQHLSNPVLLAFLAGQDDAKFEELANKPEQLVNYYFDRLLEREMERQELRMEPREQYEVFVRLAENMVEEDYTAEDHEYLKMQISDANASLITQVRNRYPADIRPTQDELATKLVSHALMDRKGEDDDRVGYVNDFVLGNFVGEAAIKSKSDEWVAAEGFIDQAISAFSPRMGSKRELLWEKLHFALEFLPVERKIYSDIALLGSPKRDLDGETLTGLQIQYTTLGGNFLIYNCVFSGCSFSNTHFVLGNFKNVTFVGCRFYSCTFEIEEEVKQLEIYLTGCEGDCSELSNIIESISGAERFTEKDSLEIYERSVLEQFWPVGRPHYWHRKQVNTLYRGHSNEERSLISEAIDSLIHKNLIFVKGDTAILNTEDLTVILEILGRGN